MEPTKSSDETYFALREGKELGDAILERKRTYERFVESAGLTRVWRKMHWRYYGASPSGDQDDQSVGTDGPSGEIHFLMMNHLRADVSIWLNLAFNQRTEMEPQATTDDYEGEIEVKRAKATLEYYTAKAHIEERENEVGEYAGVYGMGYIMRWWNRFRGKVVAAPTPTFEGEPPTDEQPLRAGELESFSLTPMDCFVDPTSRTGERQWTICRVYQNRYDKMVEYPEFAQQIAEATSEDDVTQNLTQRVDILGLARVGESKNHRDEIPVFYFFHEPTPAVPEGLVVVLINSDIILEKFPLTDVYERMPVQRLAASEIHRTPFGYSPAWGLLAPQEAQTVLSTIAMSNASTFGLGIVISPKGADIDNTDLGGGLKLVEYTPGLERPSALQMPQTPQEVYAFRQGLISEMGTLIGVNSVVRGDPEASLKSGSALALVQATAVQFSNDFQKKIVIWKELHHFDTISIAQMNMREELQPEIAGNYQASLLKAFTGEQFKKVKKVKCSGVNPMSKTLAGKVQIADTLIERFPGQLTPGDYMRMLDTGEIDYLTRGEAQRRRNLDRENELLSSGIGPVPIVEVPVMGPMGPLVDPMNGQPVTEEKSQPQPGVRYVRALITDDHRAHILKHLEVLDNPAVRESTSPEAQAVIDAVLGHVEEHEKLAVQATTTRLTLLELTNQPPLQSALPPPMPPEGAVAESAPTPGGKAQGGQPPKKSSGSADATLQPTPAGASQQPRQPQMPVNPATGQRVENMPGPV